MQLLKIMVTWKAEGRKKTRSSPKNLQIWDLYSHERKRSKNGRMEQSKAIEYGSRKASPHVLKPRNIYIYIIFYRVTVVYGKHTRGVFSCH
jgi:hypothetical protein